MRRHWWTRLWMALLLALLAGSASGGLFDRLGGASRERVLAADQAFQVLIDASDAMSLEARWNIASGYYLYRDKLQLSLLDPKGVSIKTLEIPPGKTKNDPYFGPQQVFHNQLAIRARLDREILEPQSIQVRVDYQGCAEIGVCYPPLQRIMTVALPALSATSKPPAPASSTTGAETGVSVSSINDADRLPTRSQATVGESEQDRLARLLSEQRFWAIPAFFGFGLLLAFTPCMLPMIPILSSLIIGQGTRLDRRKTFLLSLTYVLAMALTYTLAGLLAALLGQNIQAWFQNPWVLGLFSLLFVLLALSMFGLYELQPPNNLQNRLTAWSNRQRGGQHAGVAVMGLLSALIVSPCVAPPLIGALTFITVTGDLVLGAATLFALSLGMGTPLLAIGASAGHWLPQAGHWMERIKLIFGVTLLAVALWLLERIIPSALSMGLWAALMIVTATYMGALQPVAQGAPAWRTLVKGIGLVLLIYGGLLLVGAASGGRDPWQPLRGVGLITDSDRPMSAVPFRKVKTTAEVDEAVRSAQGRPVLLDFYADWCVSCHEMERYTFTDPRVRVALSQIITLRADVTANDPADQDLMKRFSIVGPPALIFFGPDGRELREYRLVGFLGADPFAKHINKLIETKS